MPHIRRLATGGTFAGVRARRGHRATARRAESLERAVVPPDRTIDIADIDTAGSFSRQWRDLTAMLRGIANALADSVVVTLFTLRAGLSL